MSLRKNFRILFGLQCVLVVGLAILTVALFLNQQKLSQSQQVHLRSYLFADELRQSTDDLTRLARTYVATGDAEYERQYWAVLAIRNGTSPRPADYNRIYWDFVTKSGQKPRADGETISLRDLMIREGVTAAEFAKLAAAQKHSDALVKTERIAMNAVKGRFEDGAGNFSVRRAPDRERAIRLLNDAAYHKNKAEIMRPIDEFYALLAERTAGDVARHERLALALLAALGALIAVVLGLCGYSFVTLQRQTTGRERAQIALRQAEELHRVTLQSVGEAVIFTDLQGRVQMMNAVAETLTGWRQLEAHEKPVATVFRIINETTRQPVESPVDKALREGEVVGLANHTLLLARDGTERPIADAAAPIRDRGNKLIGVVLVFRDQTQERAATKALRESEARLQAILDQTPSPVYVLDREGRFTLVNRQLAALLGRPRTAILGQTREAFLPKEIAAAHRANDLEVMRAGQPLILEEVNDEPDGRHTYLSSKFPLRDEKGAITGLCGISTNITERNRLSAELALREAKFRAIFDHAPVGISFTTDDGIMMVNAEHARITGVPVAESKVPGVFGRASRPEDYARQKEAAKKFHNNEVGHYTVEKRYLHPDGRVQWAELTSRFFPDPATGRRWIVTTVTDIAVRKEAEEARRASEERHRAILHTAMDGFWRVDLQGRLLEVNAAYGRMSGYTEPELLALSIPDLEAAEAAADTAARMQQIVAQGEGRFESRHRRKDGSIFEVEVSVQYKATDGEHMVAFLRDITERKRAEAALRTSA